MRCRMRRAPAWAVLLIAGPMFSLRCREAVQFVDPRLKPVETCTDLDFRTKCLLLDDPDPGAGRRCGFDPGHQAHQQPDKWQAGRPVALDGATQSRNVDRSGPRLERMANLVKNFQFRAAITQPSQVIVEAGWIRRAFQQRQIGASYKFAVLTAEQSVEIFRCPGGRDRIRVARCGGCQRQVKCLAQPRDRTRVGRRLGRVEHLAEDLCLGSSGPQSAKIKRHFPRIGFSPE